MGIKIIAREWKAGTDECRCKFICDTDADFENLPEALAGSTAISLWSKKERVVNTKGRWVPYGENFVGSPILDLLTVESEGGGAVEYGKEYQFKDAEAMTKALPEINEIISSIPETDGAKIICTNTGNGTMLATMPDAIVIGNSNGMIASYRAVELSREMSGTTIILPTGWYSGMGGIDTNEALKGGTDATDDPTVRIVRTIEPPTFVFPTEGQLETTLTMEQISLFFEVAGTKTVLSVTDTNDEGIVASYEVYADEALVDTVPKAETIDATALGVTAGASVTVKAKSIIDTTSEASNAVIFE